MKLFDSHCHLDDHAYDRDIDTVVARARDAGVKAAMIVGIGKIFVVEYLVFASDGRTFAVVVLGVDEVFDGGFAQFGKVRSSEKQIDMLLDKVDLGKGTINTTGRPYDHPLKMRVKSSDVKVDVDESETAAKDDDPKKISNDINHVPDQNVGGLLKSVHDELSEAQIWKMIAEMRINEDYKAYFSSMLKKYGYSSPAQIPPDKKKEFFNAVSAGWKGKK